MFFLVMSLCGAFAFCVQTQVYADQPLKALPEQKFDEALTEMVAEYDKDGVTQDAAERNPYISERLILQSTDPYVDPEDYGAVDAIRDRTGMYILQFDSVHDTMKAEAQLERENATVYVVPDRYVFLQDDCYTQGEVHNSDIYADIHEMMCESPRSIGADVLGAELTGVSGSVKVALLDTGVDFSARELSSRIDTENACSYVADSKVNVREDAPDDVRNPAAGHGSHVAGIIAVCTEQVAGKVSIMPVRVMNNEGYGLTSAVIEGIKYAADHDATVINMSIGGEADPDAAMKAAIDYAVGKGATVVVAAGNDHDSTMKYEPSNVDECIVVGAVDSHNDIAYFSNYGQTLDVVAPGVSIMSNTFYYIKDSNTNHMAYAQMNGTSMSTPHASGAAALICLKYPDAIPQEVESILTQSTRDLGAPGWDQYYGHGVIDLSLLVGAPNNQVSKVSEHIARKRAEEEKEKAEEEARKKAEEEARKKAEEEARKKAEEEARKKAEEEARKKAEEEARKKAEEEARKKAEEEARKKAEEEARKKAEEEAARNAAQGSAPSAAPAAAPAPAPPAASEGTGQNTVQEAALYEDSHPSANASYTIPLQIGHTSDSIAVTGLGANDSVVSWESSDPSVLTVQGMPDGTCRVTAGKKTGSAVITARTSSQATVTFPVQIQKKKVPLKGVTVPEKQITLQSGQNRNLHALPNPVTADGTIKYSSSKKSVAVVTSDGTVIAKNPGTAVITVKCGKKKAKVNVTVTRP